MRLVVGARALWSPLFAALCLLQPHQASSDVLQQYLKTRTVTQDALVDPDFPSPALSANDVEDSRTWTNNNQNVRLDSTLVVEFNEAIQLGFGYITFQPPIANLGTSSAAATTLAVPSSNVVVSGSQLVLNNNPRTANVFGESTVYTVSFDAGVVQDLGVPADVNAAFSVQFTTGDFSEPIRTAESPVDDAPAVDISSHVVLTFSEAVQANADPVSITIKDVYERQTPIQHDRPCSDPTVVINGNTVTVQIVPGTFPLLPCQKYQVVYSARCFYDTSPNHNWVQSLPSLAYYDFWTSCITAYSPLQSSLNNLISTNVVLTFSEAVLPGTGDIVLTPLGETPQNFGITSTDVAFDASTNQVTVIGSVGPTYLCSALTMQNCKGKPVDVSFASGVIHRADTSSPAPSLTLPNALTEQLTGSAYRFTLQPADLTPPVITIVSMYGISESVIRVTVRLDESGTTYCRAYPTEGFSPVSQGGPDVPTLTDCAACTKEINSGTLTNFVGDSAYDPVRKFAEHEVDVTGLVDKTMYWVYCYSHDIEIPVVNTVTSSQMLATERQVRTLDTTPPTFTSFTCVPTTGLEDSVTVTLSLNEAGRAYCKVVNRGFTQPSPNAVIAEGFFADTLDTSTFVITVNQVTTGLGATGMEGLFRKTDYDIYCWAQDAEGYPYHGPNGMADVVFCPDNHVTTLDLTPPNMRFVMAESISRSQIQITLQVDEGARVWCAAWDVDNDPLITNADYETKIKGKETDCMDTKGRQCGTFWIYDLDDMEDTSADLVDGRNDYDSSQHWKYNQDFDIIVYNLIEEKDYPYIYCYAEDDEQDGVGGAPNKMIFDASANVGPNNVHTIAAGIPTVQTLDESPPSFTQLSMLDPTAYNDRIIVTFSLNEAGTTYCRVTRSDSGETTLRINRILTANFGASVASPGDIQYITVDKLDARDSQVLYEATQYDVYCWALDAAVDTQGQPRPNYMLQDYVEADVAAIMAPNGGRTLSVWVKDMTPPQLIYISSEALSQETIQITLQLNEPGTVWCQPVLPAVDGTFVDTADVIASNYKSYIQGRSTMATFREFVPQSYINVDVEVNKLERDDATFAVPLSQETAYNIFCFAQDDWDIEAVNAASRSINFNHVTNNVGPANEITFAWAQNFQTRIGLVTTLDLTPPSITVTDIYSGETTITVTLRLDETGTAWCQAVRKDFNVPTILEILDTNFYTEYVPSNPSDVINVTLTGYDRPKNYNNSYVTPLVLGTDYDVYCYADDDLCQGCKVTNGVSSSAVQGTKRTIRTKDYTRPNMRFVAAESIAADQIHITLQVDEGAKVWCAAWDTDPGLTEGDYEVRLKAYSPACHDNKGRECGQFWVYDLDDMEDGPADGVDDRADYDLDVNWKYNQDVDIILSQLTEELDYPYIYCYAEDDEVPPNKMRWDLGGGGAGPDNVHTMGAEIGTIQTLDESPPSFTYLAILDPTLDNNSIVVTFQLNEAGTTYCRVTRSDSGETTLRINQILSANYAAEVLAPATAGYITVDKLESRDPSEMVLYQATQYDVYCWAKDSAVDTQNQPRPNYMRQDYLESPSVAIAAPQGGKTASVWVKDTTPPTLIYVSSEALTDTTIQITLQLDEPGTVWCHPVEPTASATYVDVADVTAGTYIQYIKGRHASFMEFVPVPHVNVDVEVDKLDEDAGSNSALLSKETPYNIFCFAEDDWKIEAQYSALHSQNFAIGNAATPSMTVGNGNEITVDAAIAFKDELGIVTTLDLTPPSITIVSVTSVETTIVVNLRLDETGTAWCQAVRKDFNVPTILEILDTNFFNTYTYSSGSSSDTVNVTLTGYDRPKNADNSYVTPLVLGTDYDVYCYADDDLCQGCKVTNGVSSGHVASTRTMIRTKDYTRPNMRFVAAESIARDQILVTLQVDEGSKVWCAAWDTDPGFTDAVSAETGIKGKQSDCFDGKGRQCGTFWIYDLDDMEDGNADGVESQAEYDDPANWKYNQDVDIIMNGLTEELDYPFIYCFAEDDEAIPNKMMYDSVNNAGPNNMHTMKTEIGTVQTLDESPPSFTRLALQDPTAVNDRLVVTFQLNEAGTAYCRATRSDSGETTLRINQILTANYGAEVTSPADTAYITIDKLESRDTASLYEAAQYNIYCWAKDSAVDTQQMARPNYMLQSYVEAAIGSDTTTPGGGFTANVWITDSTPPTIIVVSREALAEDVIQVTLQLNEPGTIWCQIADKDSSPHTVTPGGLYCRDMDISQTPSDPCYFETWTKGVQRPLGSTTFRADVHEPYRDHDIDMNLIEKVTPTEEGRSLLAQYHYNVWCFAEDDWRIEAMNAPAPSPIFANPPGPNKVQWAHAAAVRSAIGQVLTLDQTPPTWNTPPVGTMYAESILTVTMTLDEQGTIWCMPVRNNFAEPSINEILQNNEYNANCGPTPPCTVTLTGLQSKTLYDIWCYTEDDNVYPQRPNGRKFSSTEVIRGLSTLDTTPPILTIVSAESPLNTDIRIKVRMEEPGTVFCNSFVTGTAYGAVDFDAVVAAGFLSYVGMPGQTPGGPINTNVEVIVTGLIEETQYDTYCTAQDNSALLSVNKLLDATTLSTMPAIGQITTLDQSPPIFTTLGAKGISESTIMVTFRCNEACRAYCRVTRSDSGETSLSINRILKADYYADHTGGVAPDQTIQLMRLEDDSSLQVLERGTLYDTYCWIRDEAVQHSCYASGPGAVCETFPKPNYQSQAYVDTAYGGAPPNTVTSSLGGKMLHVRTPDTTPPNVIFIEAESTEETSITVTLQLDEPGTAYCRAYTTVQGASPALYTDLTTGVPLFKNTVTNWNNIYKNFEVKVSGLSMEVKYYVYCASEDDELVEGATTIDPQPTQNNPSAPMLTESTGRFTLDLTPPIISVVSIASMSETTATVTLQLDEPGTTWCKAVRDRFDAPSINQIIAAGFRSETPLANQDFNVRIENLQRDTEYDVYCHARDGGTEVDGIAPSAGNPGNDVTFDHVLTTKRDIHTMGDSTPPTVVSVTPVHQQTNADVNPVFQIVFNEDIQPGIGNVNFESESGTVIPLDITQANTGACVQNSAQLRIILNTFTADFSPCAASNLQANVKYYVYFVAGVMKDNSYAMNNVPAFGSSQSYYFTTGTR